MVGPDTAPSVVAAVADQVFLLSEIKGLPQEVHTKEPLYEKHKNIAVPQ